MKKYVLGLFLICFVLILGVGGYYYYNDRHIKETYSPGREVVVKEESNEENVSTQVPVPYVVEIVADNLFVPWSIVFTSNDRFLVTERNGKVRVYENGALKKEPLIQFEEVSTQSEEGLMGMALDPNYDTNKYVYVCLAYPKDGILVDKIVRMEDGGTVLTEETVILDSIPAARFHAGCRLRFGPDEKLYITTGDATDKDIAQDISSLGGKILRINSDGSFPEDNPFSNSPIWSYGHRNPQGIDWDQNGILWSTEHGPSGFDGAPGGDEVNVVKRGENYGWPLVSHEETLENTVSPQLVFTPAFAPGSATFYKGDAFPQFKNNLFIGGLKGEGLMRVVISTTDTEDVLSYEILDKISYGRIREVVVSPDGEIYFTTSNRDGRGDLRSGDDKIMKITPRQ